MKKCSLCNNLDSVHYRVKTSKHKQWIFSCKKCWLMVKNEEQYSYGGTRKS